MTDRLTGAANPNPPRTTLPGTKIANAQVPSEAAPQVAQDNVRLSTAAAHHDPHAALAVYPTGKKNAAHGEAGHDEEPSLSEKIDQIAHEAHNPHGAMHAVEAIEVAGTAAARVVGRVTRGAAVAAEITHEANPGHHGLLAKAEHLAEGGFKWVGGWLARGIRLVPGGDKALSGLKWAVAYPGKLMGPTLDAALVGTRAGGALRMTGAAGRFFGALGGRIPMVGAVFGGIIAVSDVRSTVAVLRDPKATGVEKTVAGAQGTLSLASGAAGVAALGAAGLAAVGLITAPAWIVPVMGFAAIAGAGAFVLTFFKKSSHGG